MASPSHVTSDFSDAEIRALIQDNLFKDGLEIESGRCKVSAALFSAPSNESNTSNSYTASVLAKEFLFDDPEYFDFPLSVRSIGALEFIGFTNSMATMIFHSWSVTSTAQSRRGVNSTELIETIQRFLCRLDWPEYQNMSNSQGLENLGLLPEICEAILDPHYKQIFDTETLYFWAFDTLKTNYEALLRLHKRLKCHAARTIARNQRPENDNTSYVFYRPVEGTPASEPPVFAPVPSQPRSATRILNLTCEDHCLPEAHVALQVQGDVLPGHVVLYKGMACSKIIREDGSIDMSMLSTNPQHDFNQFHPAWYWTPHKEMAEQYRSWAAERCRWSETWLVQIQVPETFIDRLQIIEGFHYGPDWKEYVWYCRSGTSEFPPNRFNDLWRTPTRADIVKGHISTGLATNVANIAKQDIQTAISEDNVMKLSDGSTKAEQWVFMRPETVQLLAQAVHGKMHIDLFAALYPLVETVEDSGEEAVVG